MSAPHKIISVVDRTSDSPIPPRPIPGIYNVFKWGVNNPSVGDRTLEKENFDSFASPAGWHALPYSVNPMFKGRDTKRTPFWRNTTNFSCCLKFSEEAGYCTGCFWRKDCKPGPMVPTPEWIWLTPTADSSNMFSMLSSQNAETVGTTARGTFLGVSGPAKT